MTELDQLNNQLLEIGSGEVLNDHELKKLKGNGKRIVSVLNPSRIRPKTFTLTIGDYTYEFISRAKYIRVLCHVQQI